MRNEESVAEQDSDDYVFGRLITPTFADPHSRVRWAACQCV